VKYSGARCMGSTRWILGAEEGCFPNLWPDWVPRQ
jgi:hypothetical protein